MAQVLTEPCPAATSYEAAVVDEHVPLARTQIELHPLPTVLASDQERTSLVVSNPRDARLREEHEVALLGVAPEQVLAVGAQEREHQRAVEHLAGTRTLGATVHRRCPQTLARLDDDGAGSLLVHHAAERLD